MNPAFGHGLFKDVSSNTLLNIQLKCMHKNAFMNCVLLLRFDSYNLKVENATNLLSKI